MSTQKTEETRATWDKIAPGYDKAVTHTHLWLGGEGLRRAELRTGMRFLDVAAGSGALSIPAARLGADVLATDQSPAMLDLLKERAHRERLIIETRVMDGHALELKDNSFDMAGSQFGVMLFPDMPRGIREMARVVKPEGRVLLIAFGDLQRSSSSSFSCAPFNLFAPISTAHRQTRLHSLSSCRIPREYAGNSPLPD